MFRLAAPVRTHRRLFPRFRVGLKIQIALLGILGVLFTGAICLVGLNHAAMTQLESDQSVNLRLHVLGLSANYLEARQIATEFLRKHDEKLIDKHVGVLETALGHLSEIERSVEKLEDGDPLKQISALRSGLNLYQTRFHNLVSMQRVLGLNENQVLQRKRPTLDALIKAADDRYRLSEARAAKLRQSLLWTIVAATLCIGLLAIYFGQRIANSIARMTHAMQKLASGDFGVVLPGLGRSDEGGDMAQAVETFKIKAKTRAENEAAAKVQQELSVVAARKADMHKLADQFEGAVGRIIDTVSAASTELEIAASTLTATAERSQQLTNVVAAASEDATANVQSVASATEQMSSSVNEISRQVQDSARIASEAVEQAQMTNNRVSELSKAASRIGDVVKLINTIAGQTNLLALNATIEAARAGVAGRGFAVVASEVKALSTQTAKATEEIADQIQAIRDATGETAGAIRESGATIGHIARIAATIAAAVEEQGASTNEMSRSVHQAAEGTQGVMQNIAGVTQASGQVGTAAELVLGSAGELARQSERLK